MLPLDLSRKWWLPFGPWPVTDALIGVLVGGEVAGRYARTLLGV